MQVLPFIYTQNIPTMKGLLSFCFLLITLGLLAQAPKYKKAELKTPFAQCEECKVRIETNAPKYVDGLVKITVNIKRQITQVQWAPDRTNIEEIKTAIANVGFDVEDITASPDAYKRLPDCCKRLQDRKIITNIPKPVRQ